MGRKDKLKKFAAIRTFPNVYCSKNHEEPLVVDYQGQELDMKGNWKNHFGNDNPIVLELACGKGHYARGVAEMYPDKNCIGVDVKGNRIWKGASEALENEEKNVAFLRARIEFLECYFATNEVDEIWITFPDPQSKKPKKRLTYPRFLGIYDNLLKEGGLIHLKTDSQELYEASLEGLRAQDNVEILYHNNDIYGHIAL